MRHYKPILAFITLILIVFSQPKDVISQSKATKASAPQSLYDEIYQMDRLLFNAFNSRDLDQIKQLFTKDLEFYHDTGGLGSYDQNVEALKNLFLQNNDLTRELVKNSLEVYPIKDYGALQIGQHTFCHTEKGQPDCGTFKFVHIWKKQKGTWKISRVISYGH